MNDPKAPTRKTIVERIHVRHVPIDDFFFPKWMFSDGTEPQDVWNVFMETRTGLMPSNVRIHTFLSEEEATQLLQKYPVGSEILEFNAFQGFKEKKVKLIRQILDSKFPFGVCAGDDDSPLAFDMLIDAGIYDRGYGLLSKAVSDYLGKQRIGELKNRFGENWSVAAAFEYCWLELPHTSPAFIAASYQYHHYITQDDFSAGYHWRDLEILAHRVEAEATKALETRKRAGTGGSAKSMQARENRREAFMIALETVAQRNPDLIKLGEKHLASLALTIAVEDNPTLWRQGKGQMIEYLGEIRRGEAGTDMKKRYQTLFGDKPPKRLGGLM